jgi:agmatinase
MRFMKGLSYTASPAASYGKARIAIIPVPYDGTSTWLKGADKGPQAILEASQKMELYDIETNSEIYKEGIFTDDPVEEKRTPAKMVGAVKKRVEDHIKNGKFSVLIGGEHSVSIGAIQAHAQKFKELSILHLDAHSDFRDKYYGSRYNHGCVMARAKESCKNIVQAGIRSMGSEELKNIDKRNVFFAQEFDKVPVDKIVSKLSKMVYISVDLDVFDPSIMPSTGTPEPGGLLWYDVLKLLKSVIKKRELVGFDVVELCPNRNYKAADFLAALLIYKILSYHGKFYKPGRNKF